MEGWMWGDAWQFGDYYGIITIPPFNFPFSYLPKSSCNVLVEGNNPIKFLLWTSYKLLYLYYNHLGLPLCASVIKSLKQLESSTLNTINIL